MDLAVELFNVARAGASDEPKRQTLCADAFRATLDWLNKIQRERLEKNVAAGVDNVFKGTAQSESFLKGKCPTFLNNVGGILVGKVPGFIRKITILEDFSGRSPRFKLILRIFSGISPRLKLFWRICSGKMSQVLYYYFGGFVARKCP